VRILYVQYDHFFSSVEAVNIQWINVVLAKHARTKDLHEKLKQLTQIFRWFHEDLLKIINSPVKISQYLTKRSPEAFPFMMTLAFCQQPEPEF
jgi:hypothetical protein